MIHNEALTHKDIKIQNLIKPRLWDRAGWRGTGFSSYPNGDIELTLLFKDEVAANAIFDDLIREIDN